VTTNVHRSNRPEVRNPVLGLPEAALLHQLAPEPRAALRAVLASVGKAASDMAQKSLKKKKAPMWYYWHVCSVYAKHLSRAIGRAPRSTPRAVHAALRRDLDQAVAELRICYCHDDALDRLEERIEAVLDAHAALDRYETCEAAVAQERLHKALVSLDAVAGAEFYEGRTEALEECAAEACAAYTGVSTQCAEARA